MAEMGAPDVVVALGHAGGRIVGKCDRLIQVVAPYRVVGRVDNAVVVVVAGDAGGDYAEHAGGIKLAGVPREARPFQLFWPCQMAP